ncbi:hypothetical protein G7046_g8586 [Stylonectria norvegica]|nr:hypothetical protein G7046_g8586 [Stylonectria norvegica]
MPTSQLWVIFSYSPQPRRLPRNTGPDSAPESPTDQARERTWLLGHMRHWQRIYRHMLSPRFCAVDEKCANDGVAPGKMVWSQREVSYQREFKEHTTRELNDEKELDGICGMRGGLLDGGGEVSEAMDVISHLALCNYLAQDLASGREPRCVYDLGDLLPVQHYLTPAVPDPRYLSCQPVGSAFAGFTFHGAFLNPSRNTDALRPRLGPSAAMSRGGHGSVVVLTRADLDSWDNQARYHRAQDVSPKATCFRCLDKRGSEWLEVAPPVDRSPGFPRYGKALPASPPELRWGIITTALILLRGLEFVTAISRAMKYSKNGTLSPDRPGVTESGLTKFLWGSPGRWIQLMSMAEVNEDAVVLVATTSCLEHSIVRPDVYCKPRKQDLNRDAFALARHLVPVLSSTQTAKQHEMSLVEMAVIARSVGLGFDMLVKTFDICWSIAASASHSIIHDLHCLFTATAFAQNLRSTRIKGRKLKLATHTLLRSILRTGPDGWQSDLLPLSLKNTVSRKVEHDSAESFAKITRAWRSFQPGPGSYLDRTFRIGGLTLSADPGHPLDAETRRSLPRRVPKHQGPWTMQSFTWLWMAQSGPIPKLSKGPFGWRSALGHGILAGMAEGLGLAGPAPATRAKLPNLLLFED